MKTQEFSPEIRRIRTIIVPILKKSGVRKAGIFGSYARGEQNKESDLDILVEIEDKRSLLGIVNVQLKVQDALRKKVDLLEYCELNPLIKKQVLSEEIKIL